MSSAHESSDDRPTNLLGPYVYNVHFTFSLYIKNRGHLEMYFFLFLSFFFFSLYPPNQTCEMNRCHVSQALSRHAETDRFVDSDIALLPTGCATRSALPLTDPGGGTDFNKLS